jgi:hypothetical protein
MGRFSEGIRRSIPNPNVPLPYLLRKKKKKKKGEATQKVLQGESKEDHQERLCQQCFDF